MAAKAIYEQLLLQTQLTPAALERLCGLGNATIKDAMDRDGNITMATAKKIEAAIPILNISWLLTGEMPMYKDGSSQASLMDYLGNIPKQKKVRKVPNDTASLGEPGEGYTNKSGNRFVELEGGKYLMLVEEVQEKSAAGYITGWGDPDYMASLPKHAIVVDVPAKGRYRTFVIADNNESMNDGSSESIEPKDRVIGREVARQLWQNDKLHLSSWSDFTIVHRDGITTKRIVEHNVEEGYIICHCLNPDKELYPDFKIDVKDVIQIWNVIEVSKPRKR